jgi:aromatic ring hydroxylase
MLSGAEYVASLRDGRRVWVLGAGAIGDVTTHPATAAMVQHYREWYDRHRDPKWTGVLFGEERERPLAFSVPTTVPMLRRLGDAIHSVALLNAGNVSHTPGYGALIALGVLDAVKGNGLPSERIAAATAWHGAILESGRFLTFSTGGGPLSDRFLPPGERRVVRVVRQTSEGLVVSGYVGLHTAVPFAHEVFVTIGARGADTAQQAWVALPLAAEGVRVIARTPAHRSARPFVSPLSTKFDELDAILSLNEVVVPWSRVFAFGDECPRFDRGTGMASWLWWHQQIGWLARAEFTLGLALVLCEVLGAKNDPAALEAITDMVVATRTIRSCLTAAELDPETTAGGYVLPRLLHVAPATLHSIRVREQLPQLLRGIAGAAAVVAPTDADLEDPAISTELEGAFGGGAHAAKQRAAVLQLTWDHISSSLDGREASYEFFGNGGAAQWRRRLARWFPSANELASAVLEAVDSDLPAMDVTTFYPPPAPQRSR